MTEPRVKQPYHLVNAWAVKNSLMLGQFHSKGGLDEITIIPELMRMLALKGCIVTVDAIGCHISVAEQVIDRQGDYVLAVKANQPKLLHHVRQVFDRGEPHWHQNLSVDTFETHDENFTAHRDPPILDQPIRSTTLPSGGPGRAWPCSVWS